MKKIILISLFFTMTTYASSRQENTEQWQVQEASSLTKGHESSGLTYTVWLNDGYTGIGFNKKKDKVIGYPNRRAHDHIGNFNIVAGKVTFTVGEGVQIMANGVSVKGTIDVAMDSSGEPTIFIIDTFKFYVTELGKPALKIINS